MTEGNEINQELIWLAFAAIAGLVINSAILAGLLR